MHRSSAYLESAVTYPFTNSCFFSPYRNTRKSLKAPHGHGPLSQTILRGSTKFISQARARKFLTIPRFIESNRLVDYKISTIC